MIDVKALLNKLMEKVNTYKFSSSSPVSTLTSQFNFEYRANLAFSKWSDFYYCVGMPNNSRIKSFVYSGSYSVTGSTSKCHVIKEYLSNGTSGSTSLVGTYTIFSGQLTTWASSTTTTGSFYRVNATITLPTEAMPLTGSSSIPIIYASSPNYRILNLSASATADNRTITLTALLSTSATLDNTVAFTNLFLYQPYTTVSRYGNFTV